MPTKDEAKRYPNPDNYPYFCPTPGKITIAAIAPNKTIPDSETTLANIGQAVPDANLCFELQQCGFNCALIELPNTSLNLLTINNPISTTITNCRNYGIKPFIRTSTLYSNNQVNEELIKLFASDNNFGGWWLPIPDYNQVVTPNFGLIPLVSIYNQVCSKNKEYSNANSSHIMLMNALPDTNASPLQPIGEPSVDSPYKTYLKTFQKDIKPSLWATTVFPAVNVPGAVETFERNLFYRDLQILSLISLYCGRPFWYTVRCASYSRLTIPVDTKAGSTQYGTPTPYLEEMRFSAFSALAYGAQGLQYWCYRQPANNAEYAYTNAPVDTNGQKVETIWNAVQKVNLEIKALNYVFFESELLMVRHTGTTQYDATSMLKGSFGPLTSITTGTEGVLLSHLNTRGQDYLVIVNHMLRRGLLSTPIQKITLNFADCWKIQRITVKENYAEESDITSLTVEENLPSGGYLIYKWNRK